MTEHEKYHELTIDLLHTNADILREIALISNGMLGMLVIATMILIWKLK